MLSLVITLALQANTLYIMKFILSSFPTNPIFPILPIQVINIESLETIRAFYFASSEINSLGSVIMLIPESAIMSGLTKHISSESQNSSTFLLSVLPVIISPSFFIITFIYHLHHPSRATRNIIRLLLLSILMFCYRRIKQKRHRTAPMPIFM